VTSENGKRPTALAGAVVDGKFIPAFLQATYILNLMRRVFIEVNIGG
jgi:hypothetical protein